MCDDACESPAVHRESTRRARVPHRCTGCDETIRKGDTYTVTSQLYEGEWYEWKHCARCDALFSAIFAAMRASELYSGSPGVDPAFACGVSWDENFGEPPPHVAALAFWLPGEPVPRQHEEQRT